MKPLLTGSLTSVFQDLFESLLAVSLIGSIVVLLTWMIHRLFGRWLSPRLLHAFWILVMLRFVLFAVPSSPTSVLNFFPMSPGLVDPTAPPKTTPVVIRNVADAGNSIEPPSATGRYLQSLSPIDESTSPTHLSLWILLRLVWMAGFLWVLMLFVRRIFRVWKLVSQSEPASAQLEETFDRLRNQLRLSPTIQLRSTRELDVPAMAGVWHPTVLLPSWCEDELSERQLELVLTHELVHIRRCDGWIQLGAHFVTMLHWFNPLARLAARYIEDCRELSCDREVVRLQSGDNPAATQRRYGQTILQIAERLAERKQLSPVFMGGMIGNHDNLVKQRIAMLVRTGSKWKTSWAIGLVSVACMMTLIAVGFTSAQTRPAPIPGAQDTVGTEPVQAVLVTEAMVTAYRLAARQPQRSIELRVGETRQLDFDYRIPEIVINDPMVIHVNPLGPSQIRITSLQRGSTTLLIKNEKQEIEKVAIRVQPPASKANVNEVEQHHRKTVSITAKVWEVSRTQLQSLEIDFAAVSAGNLEKRDVSSIADLINGGSAANNSAGATSRFGIVDNPNLDKFLSKLQQSKAATLLSQPNLVTLDSLAAEVFVGTCVPIETIDETGDRPTVTNNHQVGVRLNIVPQINDDQTMTLEVRAEVSEVAKDLSGNIGVPGFRTRRINTGMTMEIGKTLVLVGDYRENKLGETESEIVFLITPHLHELSESQSPVREANK